VLRLTLLAPGIVEANLDRWHDPVRASLAALIKPFLVEWTE
jgi:hypothetical protein